MEIDSEKRVYARPQLIMNVRVSDGDRLLGHIVDLNERGMCLSGKGDLPFGPVQLTLTLPWAVRGKRELVVKATPRWHAFRQNGNWRMGFSFEADDEARTVINNVCAQFNDKKINR